MLRGLKHNGDSLQLVERSGIPTVRQRLLKSETCAVAQEFRPNALQSIRILKYVNRHTINVGEYSDASL